MLFSDVEVIDELKDSVGNSEEKLAERKLDDVRDVDMEGDELIETERLGEEE